MVGGVGLAQLVVGQGQHAGDVHRHVAVADHDRPLAGEIELVVGVVGVGVVPTDEGGGGVTAGQLLAGDAELAVGLAADREDDRVVEPLEILDLDVVADLDVAEEAEALARGGFFIDPDHRLDLRVVGGDAAADQAEGRGQAVEEVDLGVHVLAFEDVLSGVEAGRAGADDGDADGVVWGSDLGHGLCRVEGKTVNSERERIGNVGASRAYAASSISLQSGQMPWLSAGSSVRLKSSRRLAASSTSTHSPSTSKRSHQPHISSTSSLRGRRRIEQPLR